MAEITGMDEYGPMLGWHKHWVEFPVGTKLYTHPQPKREPLYSDVIQELADDGVFHGNVFEIVRRIEEEHGIFKLRPGSVK